MLDQQAVRMNLYSCGAVVAIQRQALHFMHHTVYSLDIFGKGNLLSSSTVTTQSCSHSVKVTVSPWPSFACACSCHAGSPCKTTINTSHTVVCAGLSCACFCHAGLPYNAQKRHDFLTAVQARATLFHEHLQFAVRVSMAGTEQTE